MKASSAFVSCLLLASLCAGPSLAQKSGHSRAITFVNKTDASIRAFLFVRGLRSQCGFPWHGPVTQVDVAKGASGTGRIEDECKGKRYPVTFEVQSAACSTVDPREPEVRGSQVVVNPPKHKRQYPPHPCDIVQ
jgi:hypothetical protein